jgi:hypothetical protein
MYVVKCMQLKTILLNFFLRKMDHFCYEARDHIIKFGLSSYVTRWESLTAKIKEQRKTKFRRIDSFMQINECGKREYVLKNVCETSIQ